MPRRMGPGKRCHWELCRRAALTLQVAPSTSCRAGRVEDGNGCSGSCRPRSWCPSRLRHCPGKRCTTGSSRSGRLPSRPTT
uniref:Putative secreted protein n=1 Tax=Ixodes ricinus TaxID=34613 RepID=A0A6B0UDG9_IXORI